MAELWKNPPKNQHPPTPKTNNPPKKTPTKHTKQYKTDLKQVKCLYYIVLLKVINSKSKYEYGRTRKNQQKPRQKPAIFFLQKQT